MVAERLICLRLSCEERSAARRAADHDQVMVAMLAG
jgi:hypothetical protein